MKKDSKNLALGYELNNVLITIFMYTRSYYTSCFLPLRTEENEFKLQPLRFRVAMKNDLLTGEIGS